VATADLLLYPIADWASPDFIPGKTFEYLSSGRPVLAIGPRVEGVEILTRHGTVEVTAHTDKNAIKRAILKYYERNSQPHQLNLVEHFERRYLSRQLAEVLNRVV